MGFLRYSIQYGSILFKISNELNPCRNIKMNKFTQIKHTNNIRKRITQSSQTKETNVQGTEFYYIASIHNRVAREFHLTVVFQNTLCKAASVPSSCLFSSSVFSSFLCVFLFSFWSLNRFPMRCCCCCYCCYYCYYGYSNFWSSTCQRDYSASVQDETSFYVCKKQTSNSLSSWC